MKLRKRDPVQKGIDDALELFESAHYTVPCYNNETGNTSYDVTPTPQFLSVRRLKQRRPDYRPGPIKVYTEQEIEDYVKSKALS